MALDNLNTVIDIDGKKMNVELTATDILHILQQSATRDDIKELRQEMRDDAQNLRQEMREDKQSLEAKIEYVDTKLTAKINDTETKLTAKINKIASKKDLYFGIFIICAVMIGSINWLSHQNPQTGAAIGEAAGNVIKKEIKKKI